MDGKRIKPIVAVIPDNKDPKMFIENENPRFWERVRSWQAKGWTIGLHGYQHIYVSRQSGILGLSRKSEFSGLSCDEQARKLDAGLAKFASERVKPDLWIAPSHSFDEVTLGLLRERGINSLSDGYFAYPGKDGRGSFWLPQQLWRLRKIPIGIWTICYHHNDWDEATQDNFEKTVIAFQSSLTDYFSLRKRYRERRIRVWEWWMARCFGLAVRLKTGSKALLF